MDTFYTPVTPLVYVSLKIHIYAPIEEIPKQINPLGLKMIFVG